MGFDLLLVAVLLACIAAGVAVYCVVAEMCEAHEITHHGWVHGHRQHHGMHSTR